MPHPHLTSRLIVFLFVILGVFVVSFGYLTLRATQKEGVLTDNAPQAQDTRTADNPALIDSPLAASVGPKDAKVVIVEFLDFQCPYCRELSATIGQLIHAHANDSVRFVFRHYPIIDTHPFALSAAYASLCAHEQGKFLEMHDALYARQDSISQALLTHVADELQLDMQRFNTCLGETTYKHFIYKDVSDATSLGITGTPTLFVNGERIVGVAPYQTLESLIQQGLAPPVRN